MGEPPASRLEACPHVAYGMVKMRRRMHGEHPSANRERKGMRTLSAFSVLATELELPVGLLVVLVALGTIQIVLLVWALVDLVRREQVALLPKWGWVIVILLANLVGSLLYLIAGRASARPATDSEPADRQPDRVQQAVDALYGEHREREDRR